MAFSFNFDKIYNMGNVNTDPEDEDVDEAVSDSYGESGEGGLPGGY